MPVVPATQVQRLNHRRGALGDDVAVTTIGGSRPVDDGSTERSLPLPTGTALAAVALIAVLCRSW